MPDSGIKMEIEGLTTKLLVENLNKDYLDNMAKLANQGNYIELGVQCRNLDITLKSYIENNFRSLSEEVSGKLNLARYGLSKIAQNIANTELVNETEVKRVWKETKLYLLNSKHVLEQIVKEGK